MHPLSTKRNPATSFVMFVKYNTKTMTDQAYHVQQPRESTLSFNPRIILYSPHNKVLASQYTQCQHQWHKSTRHLTRKWACYSQSCWSSEQRHTHPSWPCCLYHLSKTQQKTRMLFNFEHKHIKLLCISKASLLFLLKTYGIMIHCLRGFGTNFDSVKFKYMMPLYLGY